MVLKPEEIERLAESFEEKSAEEITRWSYDTFGQKLTLAFSGQVEDCVLLDILHKTAGQKADVFMLDTGRLNEEVYDLIEDLHERYGIRISLRSPDSSEVEEMVRQHGINLFYKDPNHRIMCCGIRKVNVLKKVLKDYDAWMTGIRRNQISTRVNTKKLQMDAQFSLLKIAPIADWSWKNVWDYIKTNNVPYCSLYEKGYTSIGCEPCTRPTFVKGDNPSEDELRKGRWWWEGKDTTKECGLHFSHDKT